jgi:hypothetical protein
LTPFETILDWGVKKEAQKIAQRHGEAQFREDFRLHLTKVCGQNNSVVVSEIFQNSFLGDTLFPQLFGGKDKMKLGIMFQKG